MHKSRVYKTVKHSLPHMKTSLRYKQIGFQAIGYIEDLFKEHTNENRTRLNHKELS